MSEDKMKNIRKNKYWFGVVFTIMMLVGMIVPIFNSITQQEEQADSPMQGIPHGSASWDLSHSHGPIYVDGDDIGGDDWDNIAGETWCQGDGSYDNPYRLENITIDGKGSNYCIYIRDSNSVYFEIRNCTLFNATYGIRLGSIRKGLIIDNNCSENNNKGIYMYGSYNNTIYNNTCSRNTEQGIRISSSNNNNITRNTCFENGEEDIAVVGGYYDDWNLRKCEHNYVYKNNISFTSDSFNNYYGITVQSASNNIIANNTMTNTSIRISAPEWINQPIENNTFDGNELKKGGISIHFSEEADYSKSNITSSNTVDGKPIYYYVNKTDLDDANFTNAGQVLLFGCNDSIVRDQEMSLITDHVVLFNCRNITVQNVSLNVSSDHLFKFISLYNSHNCTIFNNTIIDSDLRKQTSLISTREGIYLEGATNNTLANNTLWYCHLS
jgi:parallel beta-helix repeat protein